MNKNQDNKLALSVVATLTAGIALIYVLIAYSKLVFAVAGISILFLICAYILTQNIVAFVNVKNKSLNVQIKNGMDDLSNQIEGMSSAQAQLGKATYLYTRQAAENVATLRGNYADSQEVLFKNLSVLANAQSKSTKLLIKYDQSNTTKLISTLKDMRKNLSETMTQGFDQIQPNNADVVAILESIVEYLKNQPGTMDQSLGLQINNVAHELQNISSSISRVQQVPVQPVMPPNMMQTGASMMPQNETGATPMQPTMSSDEAALNIMTSAQQESISDTNLQASLDDMISADLTAGSSAEELFAQDTADSSISEQQIAQDIAAEAAVAESEPAPSADTEAASASEELPTDILPDNALDDLLGDIDTAEAALENTEAAASIAEQPVDETPTDTAPDSEETSTPEPVAVTPVSDDPNKQLSPDEIAALFAASSPSDSSSEPEDASSDNTAPAEEEPFTPTFTVVGKSEPEEEVPAEEAPSSQAATPTVGDMSDPNKQLSPDEIAALFAAAEPAPKKEEPAPEPVAVTPVSDDPNKQLSADEIAALFAAAEPAPKKEEPAPAPEPVAVTPVSDDPNKQLSPDEIAALFASIG